MLETSEKAAFLRQAVAGREATWAIGPGMAFASYQEPSQWGIALRIERRALDAARLQEALQRRFAQADRFAGFFLFCDTQGDLVAWHALACGAAADAERIQRDARVLMGLEQSD